MKTQKITIDGVSIGTEYPPYIIAEMSANHNGSLDNAKKIIEAAKNCGASAVKIQTYRPDTITIDCDTEDFRIHGGLWNGRTLFDLYKEAHMPWEWHKPLFEHAKALDLTIFSSPFDRTAIDLLEDLNAPAYKIASCEAIDLALIKYAASTKKPLIISTGMADDSEIYEAICAAHEGGCREIAILHCVSGYPAPPEDYNLRTIFDMHKKFRVVTGLSDHTISNTTAIASIATGASIIEKHFTLNKNGGGPDDSFSLDPEGLGELCKESFVAWKAMGKVDYSPKASELGSIQFRRSLYFVTNIKAGETITSSHIRSIRPGYGIAPKYLDQLIGKKLTKDADYGQPVKWEYFSWP